MTRHCQTSGVPLQILKSLTIAAASGTWDKISKESSDEPGSAQSPPMDCSLDFAASKCLQSADAILDDRHLLTLVYSSREANLTIGATICLFSLILTECRNREHFLVARSFLFDLP